MYDIFGFEISKLFICILIILIYTPISWVRKIEKFSFAFIFGNLLILLSCIVITSFCSNMIMSKGAATGFVPINYLSCLEMVGFSVYTYEGIGVVMPIMASCNCPDKFPKILIAAVGLLTIIYIIFGEVCYAAFGENMTEPIIMNMMPVTNPIIVVIKILYMINLICSYPLGIYPVNIIIEGYLFKSMKERTLRRKWYKNLYRCLLVISAVYLAVVV